MRLACRLEILPGRSVTERFGNARRFGFDGVGLPGRHLEDFRQELEAALPSLPVPPASLSLGFESSLLHPLESERRRCRDSLLRLMDTCTRWKVRRLNVPPLLLRDNPVRITGGAGSRPAIEERLDSLLLRQLPRLGDEALTRGILLLLEPVNRKETDYLRTIGHGARLCRRIAHDAIGLTIDTYHMHREESSVTQAINEAGGSIGHVHLAGHARDEPRAGDIDLSATFVALKTAGYDDWLEVECRHLSGPAHESLPRSVDYIRGTWNRA